MVLVNLSFPNKAARLAKWKSPLSSLPGTVSGPSDLPALAPPAPSSEITFVLRSKIMHWSLVDPGSNFQLGSAELCHLPVMQCAELQGAALVLLPGCLRVKVYEVPSPQATFHIEWLSVRWGSSLIAKVFTSLLKNHSEALEGLAKIHLIDCQDNHELQFSYPN